MSLFFVCYFAVLNHPFFPVTTMPLTAVDGWIGFQPAALFFYVTLWIYVPLLPALITERRELIRYAIAAAALSVIGLAIFIFWPTTIPRPDIDWSLHPSVSFLKTIDASGNACPSLHVAFAVFTSLGLERLLRQLHAGAMMRTVNFFWGAVIVYSTLAIKQHVSIDALAGLLLGTAVAGACFSTRPLLTVTLVTKFSALLLWFTGLPLPWAILLFLSCDGFVAYNLFAPNSQWLCRVFTRFQTDQNEIWLTIDDGPDASDTPRLLELFDRHQAKVTFFLIGEHAARHPALVTEIHQRGHEIGHHTHTHPMADFWCAFPRRVSRELDDALVVLAKSGVYPQRFRAPVGIKNFFLAGSLAARRLACVGWSVRSGDAFARDPDVVVNRIMKRVRPGDIVVVHEGDRLHPAVRVEAIARLLEAFSARGIRCVIPTAAQLR
ncbi:MAG TPA: polysaccharide deacetylase family protein [Rariglobus sp.]|jgi:peptidoglycan/xylan/chitin deacetylase (PgdA/CDA1 family)|nr:polysaccharide deacetylase family protein [Rariglobus sp.]